MSGAPSPVSVREAEPREYAEAGKVTAERMREAQRMYEAFGFERLDDRVFPDGFVLLTYRRSID